MTGVSLNLLQDIEEAAVSRAESEDVESVDTMSEAGGSPVSSMTGGGSFWPAPIRIGIGGLRAHGSLRKRSSGTGSFSEHPPIAVDRAQLIMSLLCMPAHTILLLVGVAMAGGGTAFAAQP
jgi:hypothetical protein